MEHAALFGVLLGDNAAHALEAADCWMSIAQQDDLESKTYLKKYLTRLVPALVKLTIFPEDQDPLNDDEEWNIRKSSSATLDSLTNTFRDEMLPLTIPFIEASLQQSDWRIQESGCLIFGIVAGILLKDMENYINRLLPIIIGFMKNSEFPPLKIMCAWSIGRCAAILAETPLSHQAIEAIIENASSEQNLLRKSALSTLCTILETAPVLMENNFEELGKLILARLKTGKNVGILGQLLGCVVDALKTLKKPTPEIFSSLVPAIINQERYSLQMLECVTEIARMELPALLPYVEVLISQSLNDLLDLQIEDADEDLIVSHFHLLSMLCENYPDRFSTSVKQLEYNIETRLVPFLVNLPNSKESQRAAAALVGDIVKCAPDCVTESFINIAVRMLVNAPNSSFNTNASWALGEILLQFPQNSDVINAIPALIFRLLQSFHSGSRSPNVVYASCFVMSMGIFDGIPTANLELLVGHVLSYFTGHVCHSVMTTPIKSLVKAIENNPYLLQKDHWNNFVIAISKCVAHLPWVVQTLSFFRDTIVGAADWEAFALQCPPPQQEFLCWFNSCTSEQKSPIS
jgi:hypothetical protein